MPAKLITTLIFPHKNMISYLSVSAVIFYYSFLFMMCTLIGLFSHAIHKHSCRFQVFNIIISVLTTCTFMSRQFLTIEPSFFKTTSGMHGCGHVV